MVSAADYLPFINTFTFWFIALVATYYEVDGTVVKTNLYIYHSIRGIGLAIFTAYWIKLPDEIDDSNRIDNISLVNLLHLFLAYAHHSFSRSKTEGVFKIVKISFFGSFIVLIAIFIIIPNSTDLYVLLSVYTVLYFISTTASVNVEKKWPIPYRVPTIQRTMIGVLSTKTMNDV